MNYSDYSRNSYPLNELWSSKAGHSDSTAFSRVNTNVLSVSNVFPKLYHELMHKALKLV